MINTPQAPEFRPDLATRLAIERTRVAYERTVMAAIRTSTSLITFGFSAYKFFQFEVAQHVQKTHIIGPKHFGMAMIVLGLVSLLFAWIEYHRDNRALRADYPGLPSSSIGIVAGLVMALGGVLFVITLLNG
jgi:putative membrane protein